MRTNRPVVVARIAAVLLYVASTAPAFADQSDPRLPNLFDALRAAGSTAESSVVEAEIWAIWQRTDNPDVRGTFDSGVRALNQGRLEDALTAFDEVVRISPGFAEGWNKRATVNYLLDRLDESLADIDATLALEPHHFGALSGRGLVYLKKRDLQDALRAFEQALEIGPAIAGVRDNVEMLREALGVRDI